MIVVRGDCKIVESFSLKALALSDKRQHPVTSLCYVAIRREDRLYRN